MLNAFLLAAFLTACPDSGHFCCRPPHPCCYPYPLCPPQADPLPPASITLTAGNWTVTAVADVAESVHPCDPLIVKYCPVYHVQAVEEGCKGWTFTTPRRPFRLERRGQDVAVVLDNGIVYQLGSCKG